MNKTTCKKFGTTLAGVLALIGGSAKADTFGSGTNSFSIDFADIGNAGNADDAGAGGGNYSTPYGGVGYAYRMGTYEISQDAITRATASGLLNVAAGAHTGAEPAAGMTWYEAAAFVNWLNTSTGHPAAYQLTGVTAMTLWGSEDAWQLDGENLFRHKDAAYFLPSEDEWYKAAYHQNDGVTANYWDFATGSNTNPTQAVYGGTTPGSAVYGTGPAGDPADVNLAGGLSAYGTMGQGGNIWEYQESAYDPGNDIAAEWRVLRGAWWQQSAPALASHERSAITVDSPSEVFGFRVASVPLGVPEPSSAVLLIGSGLMWIARRSRGTQ